MFQSSTDIGNRACQHCGVPRMDPVLGFTEGTERANEIGFAYGKLKRAALRRNVWQFSIRSAALRPLDTNTMLVQPAMWMSTTTYFRGSIVSDQTGFLWISKIPNNLGNQPQSSYTWEPYFGPLAVSAYDSTQSYFAGELVYTAAGDGTYNVYLSLLTGNAVDPSLPNQWNAKATYFKNQVVQQFPSWASGTTYSQGQGVTYTDGNVYVSLTGSNTGNTPPSSPASWALMPTLNLASQQVPVVTAVLPPTSSPIVEWNASTAYAVGSFALFNGTVYMCLTANTGVLPPSSLGADWVSPTGGTLYMSQIDLNIANGPNNAPALWAVGTTYGAGNKVGGSDGIIYSSLGSGNTGHDPTTDGGAHWLNTGVLNPWTTVFTQGGGNQQWLQIGGASFPAGVALASMDMPYWPKGSGPLSQAGTRNVYRLPAGWLREAPQDPKAGSTSSLGAPSGLPYTDWEYSGNYFTSWQTGAIVYWFAADVVDVTTFDDMFCEMLGYDVALAVAPIYAPSKVEQIKEDKEKYANEARTVNGVGLGAVEPAMDDYLACRY